VRLITLKEFRGRSDGKKAKKRVSVKASEPSQRRCRRCGEAGHKARTLGKKQRWILSRMPCPPISDSPHDIKSTDIVCILFDCSVPVVLRRNPSPRENIGDVRLIGMCYLYDHMEGEHFAGLTQNDIEHKAVDFRIF
jgi:hypothetical protein